MLKSYFEEPVNTLSLYEWVPTYPDHIHIGKEDNVNPSLHL